jgi:hypothetical protein
MENPNKSYLNKTYPIIQDPPSSKAFQGCCELHNEPFFNFCMNLECLKAICPECIADHISQHEQANTKADITSLRMVKTNCQKKIQAGITSLTEEVKKCKFKYILDPDAIIEEGVKKIKKFQERLTLMIENHCAKMEEGLKRRVHENLLKSSDFEGIFEKISGALGELEYMKNSLENQNPLPMYQKICLLDLKKLLNKFKSEISSVAESKDIEPVDVNIDANFHKFQLDLENMLYFKKQPEKEENQKLVYNFNTGVIPASNGEVSVLPRNESKNIKKLAQ